MAGKTTLCWNSFLGEVTGSLLLKNLSGRARKMSLGNGIGIADLVLGQGHRLIAVEVPFRHTFLTCLHHTNYGKLLQICNN